MRVYKEALPPCISPAFHITRLNCLVWLPPIKVQKLQLTTKYYPYGININLIPFMIEQFE